MKPRLGLGRRAGRSRHARWQKLREKRKRGIFILPSLLTTGNLFCGLLSVILSFEGQYTESALAIFVAMMMDILDGKVARMTNTTTQFGVEFDSLADVVSFGVAPGVLLYAWALGPLGRLGWLAAFLFVVCGALRLARFNVITAVTDRRYFVGLPIPAAAGCIASAVLLIGEQEFSRFELIGLTIATYLLALLMVSTFRYYSFKELDFARRRPFRILILLVLALLIVASHPQLFFFLLFSVYALSGPARRVVVRRTVGSLKRDADTMEHQVGTTD
jgi:CDP-diacylglycerol--serine O-phosphatidyltransferase